MRGSGIGAVVKRRHRVGLPHRVFKLAAVQLAFISGQLGRACCEQCEFGRRIIASYVKHQNQYDRLNIGDIVEVEAQIIGHRIGARRVETVAINRL